MAAKKSEYGAKDIKVLEGLEAVQRRPGMYIGSTGPKGLHHLIWEVVDNSVDEAMAGFASRIEVTLLEDGGCRVTDNGRGIPVAQHAKTKQSALTTVMTTLHAGGKFEQGAYTVSGGLHGVGISVVNALSARLDAKIVRDGSEWTQSFEKGKPTGDVKEGKAAKRTSTTITFWPDTDVFTETTEFVYTTVSQRLREMAFLNAGLEIRLTDERDEGQSETFMYKGGVVDFVKHLNTSKDPIHSHVISLQDAGEDAELEVAMQWTSAYSENVLSFANNIHTHEGGTHEEGFRTALTKALNDFGRSKNILKEKDVNLSGEDAREGLTVVISVKVRNPQFEGQTKTKLGNTEIRSYVLKTLNRVLPEWLERHSSEARRIIEKSLQAQKARDAARKARDLTRRKSLLESSALPGKLADCSSKDSSRSELFIVEGDSAAGPAKRGRDSEFQAILPIRGKILNVEKARLVKALQNTEILSLITAIGTGIGEEFDLEKARYHKVALLSVAPEERVLVTEGDGRMALRQIGPWVDGWLDVGVDVPPVETVSYNANAQTTRMSPLKQIIRHRYQGDMIRLRTAYGREVSVTTGHSVFTWVDGATVLRPADELEVGDYVVAPRCLARPDETQDEIDVLSLLVEAGETAAVRVMGESVRRVTAQTALINSDPAARFGEGRIELPLAEWNCLVARRRDLGITQADMAGRIGLREAASVSEYETGRRRPAHSVFMEYLEEIGEAVPDETVVALSHLETATAAVDTSGNARYRSISKDAWLNDVDHSQLDFLDDDVKLYARAHRELTVDRYMRIDEDFCYFLGWYLAEGSLDTRDRVCLSLGEGDDPQVDRISAAIERCFGVKPKQTQDSRHPKSKPLYFHSPLLGRILRSIGAGGKAHEKRLPDLLLNVDEKRQLAFLEGYFLGDGTTDGRHLSFTTVSAALADGVGTLLSQLGILTSFSMRGTESNPLSDRPQHQLTISGKDQLRTLEPVWRNDRRASVIREYMTGGLRTKAGKRAITISDTLVALPIVETATTPYDGDVYDFSVADDESFIAGSGGGLCCHNTDADVDGAHIRTLLLTFLFRHMKPLLEAGYVYISVPPFYRVKIGKNVHYLADDEELEAFRKDHPKAKPTRFKGLGEMNDNELAVTTLDPATRTLLRVEVEDAAYADEIFSILMGEDVASRKKFIQQNAKDVRFLDI